MRLLQFRYSSVRHSRSAKAEGDRLLQSGRNDHAEPGIEPPLHWPMESWRTRLVQCAGPPRCHGGHLVDDVSRQWVPFAEVHQQRVAISGELHAAWPAKLG